MCAAKKGKGRSKADRSAIAPKSRKLDTCAQDLPDLAPGPREIQLLDWLWQWHRTSAESYRTFG